jgi:hypothetical protein
MDDTPDSNTHNRRRKMMSFKNGMLKTFASVALTLSLFMSSQSVSAVSGCRNVKGNESVVNNGDGTTSGTITHGRKLNGTTQTVFTSAFTPTPDPTCFSFTDDLTLTTNDGVLQTHNVTLFDTANGLFSAIARIDPAASTGDFAGATGVLYINGRTTDGGATFEAELTGEICYAD